MRINPGWSRWTRKRETIILGRHGQNRFFVENRWYISPRTPVSLLAWIVPCLGNSKLAGSHTLYIQADDHLDPANCEHYKHVGDYTQLMAIRCCFGHGMPLDSHRLQFHCGHGIQNIEQSRVKTQRSCHLRGKTRSLRTHNNKGKARCEV